jgi:hypothetical protein
VIHRGGCHCGNLRFALDTALGVPRLPLRACQCSFCAHHGARSTSDPQGRVTFEVRDASRLTRYRFGLRTADFLVCGACGSYVGAWIAASGRAWSVLNANTLDDVAELTQPAEPMNYDGEDAARRAARRQARWTPATGIAA